MEDKKKAKAESIERQKLITKAWIGFNAKHPEALQDLIDYCNNLASWYRMCAEDQEMAGVPLDDHRINQLLQQARTCDTVKTYITSRIDKNVAQPIKKSK